MNNNELNIIRNKYNAIMERNKELIELKQILVELENLEIIKKYKEVKHTLEKEVITDEETMLKLIFDSDTRTKIACNIYIYDGIYVRSLRMIYKYYYLDIKNADYYSYVNLVNIDKECNLTFGELEEFETNNIIIRLSSYGLSDQKYKEIQKFYFNCLLSGYDQEKILELLEENKDKLSIKSIEGYKKASSKVRTLKKGDMNE